MKNMISTLLILLFLLCIGFQILTNSNLVIESVKTSMNLWKNNVVPSIFPYFILSEFFIYFGFTEFLSELLGPLMNKLFKMRGICSFIFIMSIFSGFPSNAKYTNELLNEHQINKDEASKILLFSHFSNPMFILGTVSISFLKYKEIGPFILFCHYMGNIIIGFLFRNYYPNIEHTSLSFKKACAKAHKKRKSNKQKLGVFFTSAIQKSLHTLLLMLGIITTFSILTTIITNYVNLPLCYQSLLSGSLEMTQGLKSISLLAIPLKFKVIYSVMILSFGGLSVHMQMFSILDTKVKYFPFLVARILHVLISSLLAYFLFNFYINLS